MEAEGVAHSKNSGLVCNAVTVCAEGYLREGGRHQPFDPVVQKAAIAVLRRVGRQ